MPNWCENTLQVSGDADRVKDFKTKGRPREKDNDFSLNCFYPIPPILDMFSNPTNPVAGEDYIKELKQAEEKRLNFSFFSGYPITEEMSQAFKNVFGTDSWYDWRINNWGTKWDVSNADLIEEEKDYLFYAFETAWSPPIPWLEKVAKDWPELHLELKYQEPSMAFEGHAITETGESKVFDETFEMEECGCGGEIDCEKCHGTNLIGSIFI